MPTLIRRPAGDAARDPARDHAWSPACGSPPPAAAYLRQLPLGLIQRALREHADRRASRRCSTSIPGRSIPSQPRLAAPLLTRHPPLPRPRADPAPPRAPARGVPLHLGRAALRDSPRAPRAREAWARPSRSERSSASPAARRSGTPSRRRSPDSPTSTSTAGRTVIEHVFGHECIYLVGPRRPAAQLAGRAPAGAGEEPALRALPRLHAVPQLRRPARHRRGGARSLRPRPAASATRTAPSCSSSGAGCRCRSTCRCRTARSPWCSTFRRARPAPLWQQLGSKLREPGARPQKEGVEVRFGADQVAPFFHVFARHMRDLGTPTQPRALFEAHRRGTFGDERLVRLRLPRRPARWRRAADSAGATSSR